MRTLNRVLGPIPAFDTVNRHELWNLNNCLNRPLSGYLGGIHKGGYWVEKLIADWCGAFRVKNAIPCNSATSGILAAFMAIGIGAGDEVWAPVTSMSATAAPAKILGANVRFLDIEDTRFSISLLNLGLSKHIPIMPKALIVTNLFGHPACLRNIREWCDQNKVWMIEDNAQSILASEGNQYAGTVGHIGVFSLNVHKHLSTGEGGVVVTDDPGLALKVYDAINHGELRQGITGLNLRMTEPTAALAVAQLSKVGGIVAERRELAEEMTAMVKNIPWVEPPIEGKDCIHVYYIWAAKVTKGSRHEFVESLVRHGLPMNAGYSPLLNRVFKSGGSYPVAERMEDRELITFDICSYSPTKEQRKIMWEIFDLAGSKLS